MSTPCRQAYRAYRYFCTRHYLNGGPLLTLRASGWIACSVEAVVPLVELRT